MRIRIPNQKILIAGLASVVLSAAIGAGSGYFVASRTNNSMSSSVIATPGTPHANLTAQSSGSALSVTGVVSKVSPAVADIKTTGTTYGYFGGPTTQEGAGTGMIISSDGYILTNNHVLSTNSKNIGVTLSSGKSYTASVVATDSTHDLALIKIGASNLPTVSFGDSSQLQVGQSVLAIGNALGQFSNTVNQGIVSGLNRSITAGSQSPLDSTESLNGLIQTDASINPGDSGGPLIDASTGNVIGMNTAVASNSQGIGFAIPINQVKTFVSRYVNLA